MTVEDSDVGRLQRCERVSALSWGPSVRTRRVSSICRETFAVTGISVAVPVATSTEWILPPHDPNTRVPSGCQARFE